MNEQPQSIIYFCFLSITQLLAFFFFLGAGAVAKIGLHGFDFANLSMILLNYSLNITQDLLQPIIYL